MSAVNSHPIEQWTTETDFFDRWSLYPPEPQLLRMIDSYTPASFLDIGCGGAPYLKIYHDKGLRVLGCDINPQAIKTQRSVIPPDRVVSENFFDLSTQETFDVALIRGVLMYYAAEEKLRFINETARRLVNSTLIIEDAVADIPRTEVEYRGLTCYVEHWPALQSRIPGWTVKVLEKEDPFFLGRFMQTQIPTYKISEHMKSVKYIVLTRK